MKKAICLTILIIMLLAVSACITPGIKPSVCDAIKEPSYLCDLASSMGVRLEDIGNTFIIANSLAIANNKYTQKDALREINKLILLLDDPISYMEFRFNVEETLKKFPGLLDVARVYLDTFIQPDLILKTDRGIILKWLNHQLAILEA